jgi:D-3-phosphoglycerate dehydrogenase
MFNARCPIIDGLKLLYTGCGWLPIIDRIAARLPVGSSIARWNRREPLLAAVADVDVLMPSDVAITAEVMAAAQRLRLIQQPAAGVDCVDLAAARARQIPVCNAPAASEVAVAEHALFLLLALARRWPAAGRAFAAREIGTPFGVELAGKTLGIVGLGRSGRALADRARALGMTVIALGRGARQPERRAFFAAAHAISLHCPLEASTRGLLDDDAFAAMRPGTLVVNCARGGVIDRGALERVLATGKLGGVALDVHWNEPADPSDPLYADPCVLVTPHVAGSTEEGIARITDIVIANVDRIARGEPLAHRIV